MSFQVRHRRRLAGLGITAIAAMSLVACGTDDEAADESGDGTFPITVQHALGEIEIESKPERIVTLGAADTQIASALDATIVGAVANPAADDGNWPGVSPALPAEVTVLDSTTPNKEQIAELEPDLILATSAQPAYIDLYDELSQIAPVVTYQNELLQDSGEDLTHLIGESLGRSDEADELIEQSRADIEQFVQDHDYLKGKTVAFGQFAGDTYLVASAEAQSAQFLAELGLELPQPLVEMFGQGGEDYASSLGMVMPSEENLGVIDSADIALISAFGQGADEQFGSLALIEGSSLRASGRLNIIDTDLAAALLQPNPATTAFVLDELQGYLEQLQP